MNPVRLPKCLVARIVNQRKCIQVRVVASVEAPHSSTRMEGFLWRRLGAMERRDPSGFPRADDTLCQTLAPAWDHSPFVPDSTTRELAWRVHKVLLVFHRLAGFDVMTKANNHLNDFGEFLVNYTVSTLKNAGIKAVGATYGPFNSHQVINN